MSVPHPPRVDPEKMTLRARAYLAGGAIRSLVIGLALIVAPDLFSTDAFRVIAAVFDHDMRAWGVIFSLVGCLFAWSAWFGSEETARAALISSAVAMASWSAGFYLAFRLGGQVTPVGTVLTFGFAWADMVIASYPLRSPLEPYIRKVTSTQGHQ